MMCPDSPLPAPIRMGMDRLNAVEGFTPVGQPFFDEELRAWVTAFHLTVARETEEVPATTAWHLLVYEGYPFDRVEVYPSAEGGIVTTFPHQEHNELVAGRAWRAGKLCLISPWREREGQLGVTEPVGSADQLLEWHVRRALSWLQDAQAGTLLRPGMPFEVPAPPLLTWWRHNAVGVLRADHAPRLADDAPTEQLPWIIVHDESPWSLEAWRGRTSSWGWARMHGIAANERVRVVGSFMDARRDVAIRTWSGQPLDTSNTSSVVGLWWLLPKPFVVAPWHSPDTWGDVRIAAGPNRETRDGEEVDAMLKALATAARPLQRPLVLLVGYPIPATVGGPPQLVHWEGRVLPLLRGRGSKPADGFRPNSEGWWQRDRRDALADKMLARPARVENWHPERLQARGRLPANLRESGVAIIGAGALGSVVAELLVRAGLRHLLIIDDGVVEAGNLCRHTLFLSDVGRLKSVALAEHLRRISASVRVESTKTRLPVNPEGLAERLRGYDVILDCTAEDSVLQTLGHIADDQPRQFFSFSLGTGGSRLFSFASVGTTFPWADFERAFKPWRELQHGERRGLGEVFEGPGCWSPLFPARYDNVVSAAATCVWQMENMVAVPPVAPTLNVFERDNGDEGFRRRAILQENVVPQE
jgi:hypothetical protein